MVKKQNSKEARKKIRARIRAKISGTQERPRLAVFRSANHIYAQLIDDAAGVTLAAASSMVGLMIAERAKAKSIEEVVFDRGGFIYHGRIKELAEGAREGGLKF